MPHDSVIAGFWIVSMNLWECCPCGLHSVISRLLAGGSLGFRIVHLLLPGSVWLLCGLLFRSCFPLAIPIPEVIQCYHLFSHVSIVYELISWPPAVLVFVVFFGCLLVLLLLLLFVFGFCLFAPLFCRVTAQSIMYRSYSVLFCMHTVVMTDVATALIRWICKMLLSSGLINDLARATWRWTEKCFALVSFLHGHGAQPTPWSWTWWWHRYEWCAGRQRKWKRRRKCSCEPRTNLSQTIETFRIELNGCLMRHDYGMASQFQNCIMLVLDALTDTISMPRTRRVEVFTGLGDSLESGDQTRPQLPEMVDRSSTIL